MVILTKKYRIVWDGDTKELLLDPNIEYSNKTKTHTNTSNCFESDNFDEISNKINEEGLIERSIIDE